MPIYMLTEDIVFPDPHLAENGILAVGGDLSSERLMLAYQNGIFPWYSEGEPIIWHAPDPRFVLFPKKLKRSKKLLKIMDKGLYRCTINKRYTGLSGKREESRLIENGLIPWNRSAAKLNAGRAPEPN